MFLVAYTQFYKRLCPSVRPSVMIGSKSGKTRISAPAHPSATDGRVSGLVLFHEDSDFFNYQIFMRLICNSPSVGRVESSLNGKSRIKNSLGEHALGHRGNPKEIGSRKGQAHDGNGMKANMGPLSSNLSLNTQIRSSSPTQKHFILTYYLTPP